MVSRTLLGLTLIIGALSVLVVSCGDDDSPVESDDPLPAALAVEPASLDFATETTQMVLLVSNTGGVTLTWTCENDSEFVSCSPDTGSLTTGVDTIFVDAIRDGLGYGEHVDTITITSNGGLAKIPVSITVALTPLPSLVGDYAGILSYSVSLGSSGWVITEYPITWRFSDQIYWMTDDSVDDVALCEPSGSYIATAKVVQLTQITDGCGDGSTDPALNPEGEFYWEMKTDSLIMNQLDTVNHVLTWISLLRVKE